MRPIPSCSGMRTADPSTVSAFKQYSRYVVNGMVNGRDLFEL